MPPSSEVFSPDSWLSVCGFFAKAIPNDGAAGWKAGVGEADDVEKPPNTAGGGLGCSDLPTADEPNTKEPAQSTCLH